MLIDGRLKDTMWWLLNEMESGMLGVNYVTMNKVRQCAEQKPIFKVCF